MVGCYGLQILLFGRSNSTAFRLHPHLHFVHIEFDHDGPKIYYQEAADNWKLSLVICQDIVGLTAYS